MLLRFRIETRKIKQPRIVVLRISNENGKLIEKQIGSFSSKRGYNHIVEQLSNEELYEFDNFIRTTQFSKELFNCNADKLDRFLIKTAPEFEKSLYEIWNMSREFGIDFVPEYEMLFSVLNKAKAVEQQLTAFSNGKFKALAKYDIDINSFNPPSKKQNDDMLIFSSVIENAESMEDLAKQFNHIAVNKYQKQPKFKPHHFDFFVGKDKEEGKSSFPKWYYTVAIDVLCERKIDFSNIHPKVITEHWLRLNKKESTEKTIHAFKQQFDSLKNNELCLNIIKFAFFTDELIKIQGSGNTVPVPSHAINQWLVRWKHKHPQTELIKAVNDFKKEFPIFAENHFLLNVLEKSISE